MVVNPLIHFLWSTTLHTMPFPSPRITRFNKTKTNEKKMINPLLDSHFRIFILCPLLPPLMSTFYPFPLPSISPYLHFLSPSSSIVEPPFFSGPHFHLLISPPSAHSNPTLLKPNRRSQFGDPISTFDDDEEEEEDEIVEDSNSNSCLDDDDGGGIPWFNDDEDEFAEPANLNRGQQRSKLLAATKLRSGTRKKTSGVNGKTNGKGKWEGKKGPRRKYSQLAEEFRLDTRWIPLLDYLSTFGIKESHLVQMYRRHTNAFHINVYSARERLNYLLDVGVKHNDIKKMLLRQPQILGYTVDSNMKSHVAFLLDLGIPESKIGQVITAAPSIFSYSLKNSLKPTVRYLIEEVGIKKSNLGKVVTLSPQILVQRVDVSWNDRYDFLSEELGAPKDSVVKMVTKHPQLLHYSIEDGLLPRINFLRSIGMQDSEILKVLTSITQVLSLSLEANLKPKYMYLVNELQNEVQSLTKYPMYLSLSLEQRIRPRHRFLVFLNRAPEGPFPLSSLVPTDESFCQQWAGTSVDKYLAFRQSLMLKELAKKYEKQG
ncbi:transcription termination factor MTERF9, chloroplastic isoform X2 [Amaranthus tricolor]|uniref:transcription termination factor MTERF9, chloroplastic isoform X2 n=1 Tax=Amaranthus tricolor TaxID=29722 RepID=UPI002587E0A4|nr:transcription termination factor MTERF9, chloroplastic isoform X2 [Amaranthus tricolor]